MADIFALKASLRSQVLLAAKAFCKKSPANRLEQSQLVCAKLFESPAFAPVRDIENRYIDALDKSSSSDATGQRNFSSVTQQQQQQQKPFCIGLYLSLWYEIDLDPLIHRLLAVRELPQQIMQARLMQLAEAAKSGGGSNNGSSADQAIFDLPPAPRIFVPELGSGSPSSSPFAAMERENEMRFVEIMSAQDLEKNFAPVPPFNIREPPKHGGGAAPDKIWGARTCITAEQQQDSSSSSASSSTVSLDVVVVPGVAFDFEGNRLGKGAGYYDRWIHASKSVSSLFIGVGFDEQLPNFSMNTSAATNSAAATNAAAAGGGGEKEDAGAAAVGLLKQEQQRSFWCNSVVAANGAESRAESKSSQPLSTMLLHTVPMVPGHDMPLDMIVTPNFTVMGR